MKANRKKWVLILPLTGMLLFLFLTAVSACIYPGGSYTFPDSKAFSLSHNYLCDLLDSRAIRGGRNPGSRFARWGLGALCAGVIYLWYHLPGLFTMGPKGKAWLRWSGILALGSLAFLGSDTHDPVVRIAGVLGVLAMGILLAALFREGLGGLFAMGLAAQLLLLLNITMYETDWQRTWLPLVQKVTLAIYLLWFLFLSRQGYRKSGNV